MAEDDNDEAALPHLVLVNDEEQHSLWRADLEVPAGWRRVFGPGKKNDCLDYVKANWNDLRPLSLRRAIDAARRSGGAGGTNKTDPGMKPQVDSAG